MDLIGGLICVGLLLWWIILSDLNKRDLLKRWLDENEKREANERAAKLASEAYERAADIEMRNAEIRHLRETHRETMEHRQEIIQYRREIQKELARLDAAVTAIEMEQRREQDRNSREERFLNSCRDQCRRAQNDDGLLPLEAAGRILGWRPFRTWEGTLAFNSRGGVRSEDGLCGLGTAEHPFPEMVGHRARANALLSNDGPSPAQSLTGGASPPPTPSKSMPADIGGVGGETPPSGQSDDGSDIASAIVKNILAQESKPEEIQNGFFRTSDVIAWIDEGERREQKFRTFMLEILERERQDKLNEIERLHSERQKLVASGQQLW
jgi:hypothetical protein